MGGYKTMAEKEVRHILLGTGHNHKVKSRLSFSFAPRSIVFSFHQGRQDALIFRSWNAVNSGILREYIVFRLGEHRPIT